MINLTKKAQQTLKSDKVEIVKTPPEVSDNMFNVHMCLTKGELLALKHAADAYGTVSPVGADIAAFINNAVYRGKVTF